MIAVKTQTKMSFKVFLLVVNCFVMAVGQISGPMLGKLYFLHGGKRKWLQSCLLSVGFPILIIPIAISFAIRKRAKSTNAAVLVTRWLVGASAVLGCMIGTCSYLYTVGVSYIPLSVCSLLGSSQLVFTAVFAFWIVKQKFTQYSINAVVLMTMGSVILGLHMNGDRPAGESDCKYARGFFMTLAAAVLHGFIMPSMEYSRVRSGVPVTYELVMQFQFLLSMFATLFCTLAMIINKDFQAIPGEAKEFNLGEKKYYMILGLAAISLQVLMVGFLGAIFSSTSLLVGVVCAVLVPVQQVFYVIFLRESFNSEKCMALAMCLWGFTSYFYGEYKQSKKKPLEKQAADQEGEV